MQAKTPQQAWCVLAAVLATLAGCASPQRAETPAVATEPARDLILSALPPGVADRAGWADDIEAAFKALSLRATRENVCAVTAVVEQESGFHVDPIIPGLPAMAWREIDARAERAGVPSVLVHGVLQLKSSTGRSFSDRIDGARTEKDLSDIFEDFIGTVPLGQRLFSDKNPIRTRGPMQVNVAFVQHFAARQQYPYPLKSSIEDESFTRRGSLYFGIAHLLDYPAPYDRYLYRFADYNAGQYASRNAAFQKALGILTGTALTADGALLPTGSGTQDSGETEQAVRALATRLRISEGSIHDSLALGRSEEFEHTPLYQHVFARANEAAHRPPPRAVVPQIKLHGPKISRKLTTEWYAQRVDERFRRCLAR